MLLASIIKIDNSFISENLDCVVIVWIPYLRQVRSRLIIMMA